MANLDTRSKRASSVQILEWSTLAPPLPDGTIDQGDEQHTAHAYSGILATPPAPVVEVPFPLLGADPHWGWRNWQWGDR